MRELIRSIDAAETAYQSGDDQAVIDVLNDKTERVVFQSSDSDLSPGHATYGSVADDIGDAEMLSLLTAIESQLDHVVDGPTYRLVDARLRFDSLDLTKNRNRRPVRDALTAASIAHGPFLALGYKNRSPAQLSYDRAATLDDVAEARRQDAFEAFTATANAFSDAAILVADNARQAAHEARQAGQTPAEIIAAGQAVLDAG